MAYVEKQKNFVKKLYWGVEQLQLVKVNPTREELNKMLGIPDKDDDKEIEYLKDDFELKGKDTEGNDTSDFVTKLNIVFWMKGVKTKEFFPITFSLYNKDAISKTGLHQYVNQFGKSNYVDAEENLKSFFTECSYKPSKDSEAQIVDLVYRKAKMGEADLLNFIAKFTNINTFKPQNNLFLEDYSKFWKGNVKELREFLSNFEESTICSLLGVKHKDVTDDEGNTETKHYQVVSGKYIFPGHLLKYFKNYSKTGLENMPKKVGYDSLYDLTYFKDQVTDSEYGFKDSYVLKEVEEYDPNADVVNSNQGDVTPSNSGY